VVGTAVGSDGLSDGMEITTGGGTLYARKNGDAWRIENADGTSSANVVLADVEADNGVAHVLDAVILPPDQADDDAEGDSSAVSAGLSVAVGLVVMALHLTQ
jgi:hypothetical protein